MLSTGKRAGLAAVVGLLAPASAAGPGGPCDPPVGPRWHRGPVQYLLSPDDLREFGRLDRVDERDAWAEAFWKRHDPDPRTPENELRERFLGRCKEAERRYESIRTEGWKTDRGKVFILFGPPDAVRRDAGDALGRDREIWTYGTGAGYRGAPFEVVFRRDGAGDFVLTFDPRAGEEDPLSPTREPETRRQFYRANPGLGLPDYQLYLEVLKARPEDPATVDARGPDFVIGPRGQPDAFPRDQTASSEVGLLDRVYRFRAEDGSLFALVVLTVLGQEGEHEPEAAVWVRRLGDARREAPAWRFDLDPRPELSGPGRSSFSAKVHLEPAASYDLRFGARCPEQKALWIRDRVLEGAGAPGSLEISSIVPAESFGPARDRDDDPFAIGSERVVPRPSATFRKGEEPLRLYFQVYGAAARPRTGSASVDVRFRFWREAGGRVSRHGPTMRIRGANGASMGLTLPVADWPAGAYRVRVDLRDRATRKRIAANAEFRLVN